MRDLVGFVLESSLCLGSGGWSQEGDTGVEYLATAFTISRFTHLFLSSSVSIHLRHGGYNLA